MVRICRHRHSAQSYNGNKQTHSYSHLNASTSCLIIGPNGPNVCRVGDYNTASPLVTRFWQDPGIPHPVRGADAQGALHATERDRGHRHCAHPRAGHADLQCGARRDEGPLPDARHGDGRCQQANRGRAAGQGSQLAGGYPWAIAGPLAEHEGTIRE